VLHCIRLGTTLDQAGTALEGNAEAYLRSELSMRKLFSDHAAWVDRTGEIGESLRFSLSELRYRFPCALEPGESADEKLRRLTFAGLSGRYLDGVPDGVVRQIEKELRLIAELEVAPYFLSTYEVVEMARRRRILWRKASRPRTAIAMSTPQPRTAPSAAAARPCQGWP
jgi:error-prone DNA polymerase